MISKFDDKIYKEVAAEFDVKYETVAKYDELFWRISVRIVNDCRYNRVTVPYIGSFVLRPKKLKLLLNTKLRRLKKRKAYMLEHPSEQSVKVYEKGCREFRILWKLKRKLIKYGVEI